MVPDEEVPGAAAMGPLRQCPPFSWRLRWAWDPPCGRSTSRAVSRSYFHADGLGSITSLSNSAGTIANTYTYDSYGNLTASTGTLVNPFQYTARESDPETGLYYYRARYYDQTAGRFLSEDPSVFGLEKMRGH